MNTTPDTIEDEVLRDIEKPENPYKRYRGVSLRMHIHDARGRS